MSPQLHNSFKPSAEFALVEEEVRRFSRELDEELKEKEEECRLAKERALLRISEMEREALAKVEEEWKPRERDLANLEEIFAKELDQIKISVGGASSEDKPLKALTDEFFTKLLGEEP